MNYRLIRKGGNVKRYHTHQTIGENSVAAHSWGVATLILYLDEECGLNIIKAALYHDVFEYTTGDVPFTAKRDSPELKEALKKLEQRAAEAMEIDVMWNLLPGEEALLKTADMLDLCLFAVEQIKLGNQEMKSIFNNGYRFLMPHLQEHPNARASVLLAHLYEDATYV